MDNSEYTLPQWCHWICARRFRVYAPCWLYFGCFLQLLDVIIRVHAAVAIRAASCWELCSPRYTLTKSREGSWGRGIPHLCERQWNQLAQIMFSEAKLQPPRPFFSYPLPSLRHIPGLGGNLAIAPPPSMYFVTYFLSLPYALEMGYFSALVGWNLKVF